MFDTIRLYQKGENEKDFSLKTEKFKKVSDEFDHLERFYNVFTDKEVSLFIDYDLYIKGGVSITFSVPKVANGTQLKNFKLCDVEKLKKNLAKLLQDKIEIDFEKMKVSRLDISSNIETNLEAKYYVNCLMELYTKQSNYKKLLHENESFTIYNKSRRFVFYDKVQEQIKKGLETNLRKKNIFRYEIQNNKGRDVRNILGKDFYFFELFRESVFLDCVNIQKKYFKKLFLNDKEQLDLFETDKKLIETFASTSKNIVKNFLVKKYLDEDLITFQEIELLFSNYYTSRGLRKVMKELKELKFLQVKSNYSLLTEVYEKINNIYKEVV